MATSEKSSHENSSKINICSLSGLKRIAERCLCSIESQIDKKEWDEKTKSEMKQRLREVFMHALTENTTLDGEKCVLDGPDSVHSRMTTEFEPFDSEKKVWLNSSLSPQLDNAIIDTSSQRKHCPFQAVQLLAKQCKHEHNALLKVKAEAKTELEDPSVPHEVKVNDIAENLKSTTKVATKLIEDAENLSKCLHSSSVVRKSYDT